MSKYELIYIDADDTIFDYKQCERKSLVDSFGYFEIAITDEIINRYARINSALWVQYENKEIAQEKLRTERFKRLFDELEIDIDEFEFSDIYLDNLGNCTYLIDDAERILNYLSGKYKIAIITNGIAPVQKSRINKSSIKKYINYVIISEEAHFNKPDIGIFLYAENVVNYKNKEKIIIIGDSLSSDIQGGKTYGIDTCWFNQKKATNTTTLVPNYVISKLDELYGIL